MRFVPKLGTKRIVHIIGLMIKSIHSPEGSRLVTWLKKQRAESGLSMRALADRLGTAHSFVEKVEQSERRLDVIEFLYYCDALGVSPIDGLKAIRADL